MAPRLDMERFIHGLDYILFVIGTGAAVGLGEVVSRRWGGGRLLSRPMAMLLLAVLLGGWLACESAGRRAREGVESMVKGYAPTYASDLQTLGHARITNATGPDDPLYLTMIDAQRRWLAANPSINDIYTVRRTDSGDVVLIVDSETDYDRSGAYDEEREARTELGEHLYGPGEIERELIEAFAGRTMFSSEPMTDRWGTWMSAWSPMYDLNGNVEAVLGVDFDAGKWQRAISQARLTVMGYLAFVVTLLVLGGAAIQRLRASLALAGELETNLRRELQRKAEDQAQLRHAKEQAEQGLRAKSDFLSSISHEIRTPMTAVMGFIDLLLDPATPQAERERYAKRVKTNGAHLLALINDLLDLAKLDAGKMRIERTAVIPGELLNEVAESMRPLAAEKKLKLELVLGEGLDAAIVSDPTRMRQVCLNLISNAIKFTSTGSVSVRAALRGEAGDRLEVTVTDTGIGMTPEQLTRLFKPFSQGDASMSRRFGGTGLGLCISQNLAVLLGGDITVTSAAGLGSVFTATFAAPRVEFERGAIEPSGLLKGEVAQLAGGGEGVAAVADLRGELGRATPTRVPDRPLEGVRVLVVEDGPDNQRLIAALLSKAGASVTLAENGRVALDRIGDRDRRGLLFDVVLMDMQMPEMDGYTATSELRKHGSDLPIIALTAHTAEGDRERCLAAGCDEYSTKPITKVELVKVCARYAGRAAA